MTVTEAPRAVAPATAPPTPTAPPSGVAAAVGSGDPRIVGRLFVGTSLIFLLVSTVLGVLVGFDRVDTGAEGLLGEDLFAVYALQTVGLLFLVVLPLLLGLATAVVPLQVGATTVAFPRASAAAYWTYLVAGALLVASFTFGGGPFGTDAQGVELFLLAFVTVLVALTVAAISIATTVLALRTAGMTLRRTPLLAWSSMVAGVVWTLTLPVLAAVMVLAYVDLRHGPGILGGADGIYDRIAWVFWQPAVYAFAVPALGIVSDIVPTFARRRLFRHSAAMVLIGLFGALSFGGWVQLGVTPEGGAATPWIFEGPWSVVSVLAVVPLLGLFGLWATTLRKGAPRLRSPLALGIGGALLVLGGVAAGVPVIVEDFGLEGTTWMTAQANAVLLGAVVAGLAGVAFWAPKLYGKLLPGPLVGLVGVLLVVGALVHAVPDLVSGALDQARLVSGGATGLDDLDTIEALNLASAIGAVVVLAGVALLALALLRPRRGPAVGDDPWAGHTLEWATTSPPAVGNFAEVPEITSEAPVYDARHASTEATQ